MYKARWRPVPCLMDVSFIYENYGNPFWEVVMDYITKSLSKDWAHELTSAAIVATIFSITST